MNLTTIHELQGKAEVLIRRLEDAKESALESAKKESPVELAELIRASVIDINYKLSESDSPSINIAKITDRIALLNELKSIMFKIDGIEDPERHKKTKKREIVRSRQIMMAVYHRAVKNVSLKKAGDLYGMDHGTARHACKVVSDLRETDVIFNVTYLEVWEWALIQNPNFTLLPKWKS